MYQPLDGTCTTVEQSARSENAGNAAENNSQNIALDEINLKSKTMRPLVVGKHHKTSNKQNDTTAEVTCKNAESRTIQDTLNLQTPKRTDMINEDKPYLKGLSTHLVNALQGEEDMTLSTDCSGNAMMDAQSSEKNANKINVNDVNNATASKSNKATLPLKVPTKRKRDCASHIVESLSPKRRMSTRVAAKTEISNRWNAGTNYCCHTCHMCFESLIDLENHGAINNSCLHVSNEGKKIHYFRLLALVRCFYCEEYDTYAALKRHCREKHSSKQFVCIDYWDSLKCGLCSYRNGSGNKKEFWHHFKCYHTACGDKFTCYEYINENFLKWALSLGRDTLMNNSSPEKKIVDYICNHCNEHDVCGATMGFHVAKHLLTFVCSRCKTGFKHLKVLYHHNLTIHHAEDFVAPLIQANEYYEKLLEVQMLFKNGLVLSKREAQHTSVASVQDLNAGFEMYCDKQRRDLDSYKQALLMPLFTDDGARKNGQENTCKTFMQTQLVHPVLELKCVTYDDEAN